MKKIAVSDITLKIATAQDISLTFKERLLIAEKLDASGVDAIELPELINSKENEVIYRTIASTVKNSTIVVPVGSSKESLELAYECVKDAKNICLQVAFPVSTVQMEYFYHLKAPAMLAKIEEMVKASKQICNCVEFVAQDAFRAEEGFVKECVKIAVESGASIVTVCDDSGEFLFEDYAKIVDEIKSVCDAKVYVQPSNALSMAAAMAVTAIKSGADGIKTSAIGDYLSIATLSDIIRARKFELGAECGVDSTKVKSIVATIDVVADEQNNDEPTSFNGVIDCNATLHEVADAVKGMGYELSDEDVGKVYDEFKKLTSKKETIDTKELEAIVASTAMQVPSTYHLINYVVNSGNIIPATANVTLEKDGEKFTGVSTGDGPIDAAFHAIEQIIGHHYELDDFQVHAVTKGRGAVGSSILRLRANGKLYPGNGVSTDIVGACIRAYVNALNKIVYEEK